MKKGAKRKIPLIVLMVFLCILAFSYYLLIVLPIVNTYTLAETNAITERAVNIAVSNVINLSLNYDSLIDISYTNEGKIASFSANQYEINTISREIVKEAQLQMESLGEDGLSLNVGTFTGIPFFIGRGFKITLKLVPIGAVASEFESVFDSVGINMTRHTLYLYVNIHVSIVLPVKAQDITTTTQILLAESIIVGEVPQVYLNGGSLGKSLNLNH